MENNITGKDILFVSVFGGIGLTAVIGTLVTINKFANNSQIENIQEEIDPYEEKLEELKERRERRKIYEKEYKELSYKISENSLNVKDLKTFDFNECNYRISIVNQARINNDVKIKELETELKLAKVIWNLITRHIGVLFFYSSKNFIILWQHKIKLEIYLNLFYIEKS